MVSAHVSESSGLGASLGRGYCIVDFMAKTHSIQGGVEILHVAGMQTFLLLL